MWWDRSFRNKITVYTENRPIAEAVDKYLDKMPHTDIQHTSLLSDIYLDVAGDRVRHDKRLRDRFPDLKPPFDAENAGFFEIATLLFRPYWADLLLGKTRIGEPPYKKRVILFEPDISIPESVYIDNRDVMRNRTTYKGRSGTRGALSTVLDEYYTNLDGLSDEQLAGFAVLHDVWTLVRGDPEKNFANIIVASDNPVVLETAKRFGYLAGAIDLSDPQSSRTSLRRDLLENTEAEAIIDMYRHLGKEARRAAAGVTIASLPYLTACTTQPKEGVHGEAIVTLDDPAHREIVTAGMEGVTIGFERKGLDEGRGIKIEPVKEMRIYLAQFEKDKEGKIALNPEGRIRLTVGANEVTGVREEFASVNVMLHEYGNRNNVGGGIDSAESEGNLRVGGYAWVVSDALNGAFIGAGRTIDDTRIVAGMPQNKGPGFLYYRYAGEGVDEGILFGTKSSGVLEPLGFAKFLETSRNDPDASRIESPVRFVPPGTAGKARGLMGAITHKDLGVETWGVELYSDLGDVFVAGAGYVADEDALGRGIISLPIGTRLDKGYLQITPHLNLDTHETGLALTFRKKF